MPQPPVFNATDRLVIELEAQQWSQVMSLVGTGRFTDVAPIIQEMQAQIQRQQKASVSRDNVTPMANQLTGC